MSFAERQMILQTTVQIVCSAISTRQGPTLPSAIEVQTLIQTVYKTVKDLDQHSVVSSSK
jgi:hypothetical protein